MTAAAESLLQFYIVITIDPGQSCLHLTLSIADVFYTIFKAKLKRYYEQVDGILSSLSENL